MRPFSRRTALAAACVSALVLAGCGKHVAPNAPLTWAPADTPFLIANFKGAPADVVESWTNGALMSWRIGQLETFAEMAGQNNPDLGKILDAARAELADVHSGRELAQTTGLSRSALYAVYGVGDVPVARVELTSPDTFKAFWTRVVRRAGITVPTATIEKQNYWVIGGAGSPLHLLLAIEGSQLVATIAPANAGPRMLKQLLGLTKPSSNASERLAGIDSRHRYLDAGASGYVDLPKLFANLFGSNDAATQSLARALGDSMDNPACAGEFRLLASQVPLISAGMHTYSAKGARGSIDVQLSPALLGTLTALKQPVPGMDEPSDSSMFDLVLALPLERWQAFLKGRAEAAAKRTYQCPALRSLNQFARTAASPPVQMPPEAASLLGIRVVLDKWDIGPQIAGRALVASSNPAELAQKIQQTLPQFALKTIPSNGKPVAFDLPPRLQAMLGGGSQGWIAANTSALAMGIGEGEGARLAGTLNAPAGNGDTLLHMHFDGKMYQLLGGWMSRLAAMAPATSQTQVLQQAAMFAQLGKMVGSADVDVKLDDKGLHIESDVKHR